MIKIDNLCLCKVFFSKTNIAGGLLNLLVQFLLSSFIQCCLYHFLKLKELHKESSTNGIANMKQDLLAAINEIDQDFICNMNNNAGVTIYISICIFDI